MFAFMLSTSALLFLLITQPLSATEFARKGSRMLTQPLAQAPAAVPPAALTLETFRAGVGLEDLPQITDAMMQDELDTLKDLKPDEQRAIMNKIKEEMAHIRADGATPAMVQFFWEEDVPYLSWERYRKIPGQSFPRFYEALRSKSDLAFLAFLGLKPPVVQEDVEKAFIDIQSDLDKRIQENPQLTAYYTPIKAFFEELEKLPKA